jgi:hypothetical protein
MSEVLSSKQLSFSRGVVNFTGLAGALCVKHIQAALQQGSRATWEPAAPTHARKQVLAVVPLQAPRHVAVRVEGITIWLQRGGGLGPQHWWAQVSDVLLLGCFYREDQCFLSSLCLHVNPYWARGTVNI